jgi:nucleosome binding factor SPN SPT16 subunit
VDEEKVIPHSAIASELNTILAKEISNISDKLNLAIEEFSLWDNPIIQSGTFGLEDTANTIEPLEHNIVSLDVGTKVSDFHVRCRRTLLIDPQKDQERQYLLLLDCHKILLNALKSGAPLGEIYEKVHKHVSTKFDAFSGNLLSDFGACLGPEAMTDKKITKDEERSAETGEIYYIRVGFQDLESEKWVVKCYSLVIGDTVVIQDSGEPKILT